MRKLTILSLLLVLTVSLGVSWGESLKKRFEARKQEVFSESCDGCGVFMPAIDAILYTEIAGKYSEEEKPKKAIQAIDAAIESLPANPSPAKLIAIQGISQYLAEEIKTNPEHFWTRLEPLLKAWIETDKALNGRYFLRVGETLEALGGLYLHQERFDEAEKSYLEALTVYSHHSINEQEEKKQIPVLTKLAMVYFLKEEYLPAPSMARQSLAMQRRLNQPDDAFTLLSLSILFKIYSVSDRPELAVKPAQKILELRQIERFPEDLKELQSEIPFLAIKKWLEDYHRNRANSSSPS